MLIAACAGLPKKDAETAAVETVFCALNDEVLSVGVNDPDAAKAYLQELAKGLKARDPEAARQAGDLVARILECLPK
jgi:hypothetical protein